MQVQQTPNVPQFNSIHSLKLLNGVDMNRLEETISAVRENTNLAKFRFKATNHWVKGAHSNVTINDYEEANHRFARPKNFKFECDEPPELLGSDKGASPAEYALASLSSCMATTIAYQGAAEGKKIDSIEATYEGDVNLLGFLNINPKIRNGFQGITVNLQVKGDLSQQDIERLAKKSPIYDSLVNPVPVKININKIS